MRLRQKGERPSSILDRVLGLEPFPVQWEVVLYGILIAASAALRFWDLGSRALHHDESLHALYSWYLYSGKGYRHNPMMHGPFQFEMTAVVYFLVGASDYAARVLPALFGTALVGLPWLLRRHLGRAGALATSGLLSLSPVFLYYSRFARNDIYMAAWTILTVVLMWRYLEGRRARDLYPLAVVLALSFATKETAFINVAIFGSFLLLLFLGAPLLRRLGHAADHIPLNAGHLLLAAGALLVPLWVGGIKVAERIPGFTWKVADEAYAVAFVAVLAASALVGISWDKRAWPHCAAIFWGIYVVMYTTFFSNIQGFGTGVVGSLTYWLEQQEVRRGGQPGYYYLLLLGIYEFLPAIFGAAAAVYYVLRRSLFTTFLIYWAAASLLLYSLAGEKMPWLSLHVTLPLILLSGRLLGGFLARIPWRDLGANFYLAVLLPILLLGFLASLLLTLPSRGMAAPLARAEGLAAILLVLLFAALLVGLWRGLGLAASLRSLALASLVLLLLLTVRTSLRASYQNGDIPVEMAVYTQSSPEIPIIYREIERASLWKTGGKELTISVDGTSGYAWPWAWYLRDYKNVGYPSLTSLTAPPTSDVVIIHASNVERARPFLADYDEGKRYRHRWWFPEIYRELTPAKVWANMGDGAQWAQWVKYFLNRDVPVPLGSEDGYVFFRRDLPLRP